jgi:hypothetical protein
MVRTSHCTSHYNRDVNRHHATSLGQPPGTETGTPTASGLKRQDIGGTWYVASLKYTWADRNSRRQLAVPAQLAQLGFCAS